VNRKDGGAMKRRIRSGTVRSLGKTPVLMCAAISAALAASAVAQADQASFTPTFTCTGVTLAFAGFPATGTNTVTEVITVDRGTKVTRVFSFEGAAGSDTVPIALSAGHHQLDALVRWKRPAGVGGHDHFLAHGITCEPKPSFTVQKLQANERRGPGSTFTTGPLFGTRRQLVRYEIVVTNTGNVPLQIGPFSDPRCDPGTVAGGPGGLALAPGQDTVFTCTHLLSPGDQAGGSYENIATVTATPPGGEPLSVESNPVLVELPHDETTFGCEAVEFTFANFPNAPGNTVTEIVTIDHVSKIVQTFSFDGPTGSNVIPIMLAPGVHKLDGRAHWKTNGAHGAHDQVEHGKLRCVAEAVG
jgi:hypothetical protein